MLRPYQMRGVAFLASHKRALLGDEMGLGKSATAITAADEVSARTVLVVCPASVRIHWAREFTRWSHIGRRVQVVETTAEALDPDCSLIICSYTTATALEVWRQLMARTFDVLVLDEVQSLKQRTTRRAKAIYGPHSSGGGGLLERATYAWGLSGTIAPNGWATELWTHMRAFGVTEMTEPGFAHRFCVMRETKWGSTPVAHRNTAELKALLRSIYLRRCVDQVLGDLPPLQIATTPIEADASVILEAESSPALEKLRSAITDSADDDEVLTALQHASGDAIARLRHGTGLLKVPGAVEMLRDELEADHAHKVVVFAVHRAVIAGLTDGLTDFGAVVLEGATRPDDRQAAIDRFAHDPSCRVFVAQIVAGGVGISLVTAAHVVMVEASWTPAENSQAIARCRRIGQTRPVLARYLYVPDSLDESIAAVLARKSQMGAEIEAAA